MRAPWLRDAVASYAGICARRMPLSTHGLRGFTAQAGAVEAADGTLP
ncbi:MAG: hypothetical protein O2930_06120 [Acidobacteria bacterium]|nr:hypothetical protein [Acidobacteriota bacterium]